VCCAHEVVVSIEGEVERKGEVMGEWAWRSVASTEPSSAPQHRADRVDACASHTVRPPAAATLILTQQVEGAQWELRWEYRSCTRLYTRSTCSRSSVALTSA
jgi:hypothetical protein